MPETLTLEPGKLYHFRGLPGRTEGTWYAPPGTYRLLCVARNPRTGQDLAVYRGEGGPDDGNAYCVCLDDWARNFELIAPPAPPQEPAIAAEPVPGKVWNVRDTEGDKLKGLMA